MAETKILNRSWKKQLSENLHKTAQKADPRIAILGIGNELNGDDAAGLRVVQKLIETLENRLNFTCIVCGAVPENASGSLRKFKPDLVLMIDAADMGIRPGQARMVDLPSVGGFSASSHTLPLSVIADYFKHELGCPVLLLGIQPSEMEFGTTLSSVLQPAVKRIQGTLTRLFLEHFPN